MERTLETITINNALEVVRLKGELKFKHPLGYTRPSGYCFKHPVKGFFAFKGDTEPYMPCGGKKALLLSSVPAVFLILIMWFGFNHSTKYLSGVAVLLPRYYRGGYYGFWKI